MKVVVGQLWKHNYKYVNILRQKVVLLLLVSDYYNFQKFNINIYCKGHKIMTLTGCFVKGMCVLSKCRDNGSYRNSRLLARKISCPANQSGIHIFFNKIIDKDDRDSHFFLKKKNSIPLLSSRRSDNCQISLQVTRPRWPGLVGGRI